MDNEAGDFVLVGSFPKNKQEAVCAGVGEWKGQKYFFLRVFTPVIDSEDLVPTKKGINMELHFIDDLLDGVKKLGEIMGGDQDVKTIQKSENQLVKIGSSTYQGMSLLNIRTYMKYNNSNEFSPTAKGVSIRTEQYPLLLELVEKLHKYLHSEATS